MDSCKKRRQPPENLLNPAPAAQVTLATQVLRDRYQVVDFIFLSGGMLANHLNHLIITRSRSYCTTFTDISRYRQNVSLLSLIRCASPLSHEFFQKRQQPTEHQRYK
jgi:hypothetical protein